MQGCFATDIAHCKGGSFAMLSVWIVKLVLFVYVCMGWLYMVYLTQGISLSAP